MNPVSSVLGLGGGGQARREHGAEDGEAAIVKTIQAGMESCPVKATISGGMGFCLGGLFGLFMSSMSYDTPLSGQGQQLANLPLKTQLSTGFKDMGTRSLRSAKNFGIVGALYAGTECCIESYRAKNDLANSMAAGCITGGALAAQSGPQAAALGCVGFAAFSLAIDSWMHSSSD